MHLPRQTTSHDALSITQFPCLLEGANCLSEFCFWVNLSNGRIVSLGLFLGACLGRRLLVDPYVKLTSQIYIQAWCKPSPCICENPTQKKNNTWVPWRVSRDFCLVFFSYFQIQSCFQALIEHYLLWECLVFSFSWSPCLMRRILLQNAYST